jgi:predicted O-linked N-acetylglucosamine transferase (SPINDLY family)
MKSKRNDPLRPARQCSAPQPASPAAAASLLEKAVAHHQAGQLRQAEALYRQILQISPGHPDALHLLGVMACQVGRCEMALELIDQAIQINPRVAEYHSNRANALHALRRYAEEVESCDRAIHLKPESAEAHGNRGNALNGLGRYQEALESCDQAILLKPGFAKAHANRGNALNGLRRYQEAVASFDTAIQLDPRYAEAYNNRGSALHRLRQFQAALESFDKALLLKPEYAVAWCNRGSALHELQQYRAALESFDKALLLDAEFAEAHSNRGNTLHRLQEYQAAAESCDKAIALKPEFAEAWYNRGNALLGVQNYPAALESFNQALLLRPKYEYVHGMQVHMKQHLCDWADIEGQCRRLEAEIERGEKAASPFLMLAVSDSAALQKKAAEIYARDKYPPLLASAASPRHPRRDKIRVGYFSADYFNHATCYLMAELFERHDKGKFEILAFSFGPDVKDEMRQRVSAAVDRFVDVRSLPDEDVARLSRELEVDIAVDLKGFTKDSRAGIFAGRAAPIQASYLGYPCTTGAAFMDYLIADRTLIPEASQRFYSEKIVYLPGCYQVNDSRRAISARPCTRSEEGLPERGFVYCCFNNNYKIGPERFDRWMRILGRVEGSVLWLLEDNPWAGKNLRREAARRGIAPERLIFARRLPLAEHLARHRLANLFLDTFPCNAHTTASDALWAGLPVLTRMGESFASRVAASLLNAMGLPELATATEADYEALAVELALRPERLQEIGERLRQNRLAAPLFDIASSTRHLEAAYSAMYERQLAGLLPEHMQIAPLAAASSFILQKAD